MCRRHWHFRPAHLNPVQPGLSAEQIAVELPHIEQTLIFAALTFYFANRDAIESQIAEDQRVGLQLAEEDRLRKLGE